MKSLDLFRSMVKAGGMVVSVKGLKHILTTGLYGNALYLIFNSVVTSLLGLFFWMVVARFYGEVEVGFSSAIISAISLLATLSMLGLDISLIRFLPKAERPQDLINTSLTLGGLSSLAAAAIFLAGLSLWSPALRFITENAIFTLVFLAFTVAWVLSHLIEHIFIAKRRADFTLFKNTIYSLLKIPLPIFFVLFFHAFGIVASWGLACAIAVALSLFLFLPRVQRPHKLVPTIDIALLKHTWGYSSGNYMANLLSGVTYSLLPLMVVNFLGAESNAYFYVASMIALLLSAIPAAISFSLFAEGAHFEDRLKVNVVRSVKFIFLLLVPAVVVVLFAGKWLLLLFGGSYSVNALPVLQIMAVASLPAAVSYVYYTILRVTGRIRELIMLCGLSAIAILIASYLVMPQLGITGIAYVRLGVNCALVIYVFARRASIW